MPKLFHIILLLSLIFLVYSNTYDCSWQFDDHHNIVENTNLHFSSFTPETLKRVLYSRDNGKLYRPVACLTLAMNWYFGGLDVFGYHVVNIIIHLFTSIFLYLVIVQLLSVHGNNRTMSRSKHEIALLTALFWAVNPVNVQAVTYIVQRMASLATLFSIAAIYFYLQYRIQKKRGYLFAGLVCFIFGFLSKENAAMLPFSILLIEIVFFRKTGFKLTKKHVFAMAVCCLVVAAIGVALFNIDVAGLLKYDSRLFTPGQRVLTEFRILVYYLYQIFIPDISSLSIHHDIVISHSLFSPVTTFFSILFVLCLVGFSLAGMKKFPLISFAVLFYFLNHVVESSFIGLELMFEHRNYLPSLFLFLPFASFLVRLRDSYQDRSRIIVPSAIYSVILVLIWCYGMTTYSRNFDWKTEKSLWEDAMEKAPQSSRPYHNLAWSYYSRIGDNEKALELYQKALTLKFYDTNKKSMLLSNIAWIYFEKNDRNKALKFMGRAVQENPRLIKVRRRLASMLVSFGEYKTARILLQNILQENPEDMAAMFLMGKLFYFTQQYEYAVQVFQKILVSGKKQEAINYLSRIHLKQKSYETAKKILEISGSDSLEHDLLSIVTAHLQNDKKRINALFQNIYKTNTVMSVARMQNLKKYKEINREFDGVLNIVFNEALNRKVAQLRELP